MPFSPNMRTRSPLPVEENAEISGPGEKIKAMQLIFSPRTDIMQK